MKGKNVAKKKLQLRMTLDATFRVAIPADMIEKLKTEIATSKACLSVSISYGNGMEEMMSIYIDHFKSGDMKISSYANGMANFLARGEIIRDLDQNFDADFIQALKSEGLIKIKCSDLCDRDVNSYYIEGNEDIILDVGDCSLVN
jgi:hypothetical protein